jgi:DNA-binding transcriptional ArsR family regulator
MTASKIKVILHPVRMKIIQALINGKEMTVQELSKWAKDVPQATLYRHLNKLLDAGFIRVVQENPIRGAVEKVYALKETDVHSQEDFLKLTKEEHLELFLTFTTQLMSLYESYLSQEKVDLVKDGVSYTMANLNLTDQEYMELLQGIGTLIQSALTNEPTPDRKPRNIATIIIPDKQK